MKTYNVVMWKNGAIFSAGEMTEEDIKKFHENNRVLHIDVQKTTREEMRAAKVALESNSQLTVSNYTKKNKVKLYTQISEMPTVERHPLGRIIWKKIKPSWCIKYNLCLDLKIFLGNDNNATEENKLTHCQTCLIYKAGNRLHT